MKIPFISLSNLICLHIPTNKLINIQNEEFNKLARLLPNLEMSDKKEEVEGLFLNPYLRNNIIEFTSACQNPVLIKDLKLPKFASGCYYNIYPSIICY